MVLEMVHQLSIPSSGLNPLEFYLLADWSPFEMKQGVKMMCLDPISPSPGQRLAYQMAGVTLLHYIGIHPSGWSHGEGRELPAFASLRLIFAIVLVLFRIFALFNLHVLPARLDRRPWLSWGRRRRWNGRESLFLFFQWHFRQGWLALHTGCS